MSKTETNTKKKFTMPHPYIIMFAIIVLVTILTYVIPAGEFSKVEVDGRMVTDPESFTYIDKSPISIAGMFASIIEGLVQSADLMIIVFVAGGLFKVVDATGALENGIGAGVRRVRGLGVSDTIILVAVTFIFGLLGSVVGFDTNIAIIPIGALISLALGYDLMVGAAMAVGGIALGFATSPISPYTVGVSQNIAGLPIFSGILLRTVYSVVTIGILAFFVVRYAKKIKANPEASLAKGIDVEGLGLSKGLEDYEVTGIHKIVLLILVAMIGGIVYGSVQVGWYINEITTLFLVSSIIIALVGRIKMNDYVEIMIKGAADLVSGAMIIGIARGISIIMINGNIGDTIINALSVPLQQLPAMISVIGMTASHCIVNFFISSGSGKAMATMPIMLPLGDLLGITRQTSTLAFQIGDGVTNLIYPTNGGLLALLTMARVPFDRWFKFIIVPVLVILFTGIGFTIFAVAINWGPF